MLNAYPPWTIPVPGGYTNDLQEPTAAELINLERLAAAEPEVEPKLWEVETWIQALSDEPKPKPKPRQSFILLRSSTARSRL